jgi:hypothetical protein
MKDAVDWGQGMPPAAAHQSTTSSAAPPGSPTPTLVIEAMLTETRGTTRSSRSSLHSPVVQPPPNPTSPCAPRSAARRHARPTPFARYRLAWIADLRAPGGGTEQRDKREKGMRGTKQSWGAGDPGGGSSENSPEGLYEKTTTYRLFTALR